MRLKVKRIESSKQTEHTVSLNGFSTMAGGVLVPMEGQEFTIYRTIKKEEEVFLLVRHDGGPGELIDTGKVVDCGKRAEDHAEDRSKEVSFYGKGKLIHATFVGNLVPLEGDCQDFRHYYVEHL